MNLQYINVFTFVHFILWFMIGVVYPKQYGLVVVLSILWEIVEGYSVQHPIMYPLLQEYWIIPEKYWNEGMGNKITDILANVAGYYTASNIIQNNSNDKRFLYLAFILWISAIIYAKM